MVTPVIPQTERIPGAFVHIPDANLHAVLTEALGKSTGAPITSEEMATLQTLDAQNRNISDLTGIVSAKNLTELNIRDNPLSDLSPLMGLVKLHYINFQNTKVSNLSPLALLTKLREVQFRDTEVADLSPLSGLSNLEVVNASETRITTLAPLAGLKNLQKLDTVHSDITDLSPLAGLTNLTRLRLYDCKATDLSPLRGLTKLTWFGLTRTHGITDLSPLAGLTNLKHLDLVETEISDISPIAGLINLETLILDHNEIEDVSPLTSLRNLKELTLHSNNISDFSPLDGIRKNLAGFTWYSNPGFPKGGHKIEGPWEWLRLPIQKEGWPGIGLLTDYLAEASGGEVTEQRIAALGASEGDVIQNSVWSMGTLEPYNLSALSRNENNLKRLLNPQELIEFKDDEELVVYGSINLYSPRAQQTKIFIGASVGRKVWLNGEVVHAGYIFDRGNHDYQEFFPVTLKKGENILLVAVEYWDYIRSFFFGFEEGTEYEVFNPGVGYTLPETAIHVGDTFILDLSAENVYDFAGWQFDLAFDPAALEAVEVNEGDFLKTDAGTTFFRKGSINNKTGTITKLSSTRLSEDGVTGTGTLLSVTFTAKTPGQTQLTLENFQLAAITGESIPVGLPEILITIEGQLTTGDVNRDGQVSILDMVLVARQFGNTVPSDSTIDVNGDGVVNVLDLILVSQNMGKSNDAAAPSLAVINARELDPAIVRTWIAQAELEDDGSIAFQQGLAKLRELLSSLLPKETTLLPNYPNPFNPETWIPYQLSEPAEVTLRIYAINGELVRTLALGHTPAGIYQSRSRAAYWDGKNEVGESVASGIYFYTLSTESTRDSVTAGDFTATRKLLIRK